MVSKNIVVVADQWNPSILSSEWLNEHVQDARFKTEIQVPPLTVANSPRVKLICQPAKLQVILNDAEAEDDILSKVIWEITDHLPETNYTSVGINFQDAYVVNDERELREFFKQRAKIYQITNFCSDDDEDLRLQLNLTKTVENSDLTLKLIPGQYGNEHAAILDFNFHHNANTVDEIQSALDKYPAELQKAQQICTHLKGSAEEEL